MESEENVFLVNPLLYGGQVLPFAIYSKSLHSNLIEYQILTGIFDFRTPDKSIFYHKIDEYSYTGANEIANILKEDKFSIILHNAKVNLYKLISETYSELLSPLDDIDLQEADIAKILLIISQYHGRTRNNEELKLFHDAVKKISPSIAEAIRNHFFLTGHYWIINGITIN